MQKYKLKFSHYKTDDIVEKEVIEVGFPVSGYRDVFYSLTDDKYIDVIRKTIISLEAINEDATTE